jgi:hypothetical protein
MAKKQECYPQRSLPPVQKVKPAKVEDRGADCAKVQSGRNGMAAN